MQTARRLVSAFAVVIVTAVPASAETLRYNWTMRGGLSWVAGLRFPTSGVGFLTQTESGSNVTSTLRITSPKEPSAAMVYESTMLASGEKTFTSAEGYTWQQSRRHVRSLFDTVKHLLRVEKTTPKGTEEQVKPWTNGEVRDVLTAIQFLRVQGSEIAGPVQTNVYSNGTAYPVVITPIGTATVNDVRTTRFRIQAAPGAADKYPGEVRVWISADARRVPVRIELAQKLATVRLDLM